MEKAAASLEATTALIWVTMRAVIVNARKRYWARRAWCFMVGHRQNDHKALGYPSDAMLGNSPKIPCDESFREMEYKYSVHKQNDYKARDHPSDAQCWAIHQKYCVMRASRRCINSLEDHVFLFLSTLLILF